MAILCGGRGTRLQEHTREIPKPLVEIGGMPIVWHVIRLYAAQGFTRFLLATGYRGELIESFVAETPWEEGVEVRCVDTGLETQTGGRIAALGEHLAGEPTFCATYADGLADIDLDELLEFHAGHGALASMTVVRPELQFGVTEIDDRGIVRGFQEKPRSDHWINGGFFCFGAEVLDRLGGPETILEREPLGGPGRRRAAPRLPPPRLLGVHGHLQGRHRPERHVGLGQRSLGPARRGRASRRWPNRPEVRAAQAAGRRTRNSRTGSRMPFSRRSPAKE